MLYSVAVVETKRIADLLKPFLVHPLSTGQLNSISIYIDIMSRWNQRVNLTAVRDQDSIVTRHFGESLFAASRLFSDQSQVQEVRSTGSRHLVDVGSGAGFPGLPIKLFCPDIRLTLIESHQKKATFLREVARQIALADVEVFADRAENFPRASVAWVTMRAVERFDSSLPIAEGIVAPGGTLTLLIGDNQVSSAQKLATGFEWNLPVHIPLSEHRVLLSGRKAVEGSGE